MLAPMAVGAGVLGTVLNSALTKSVSPDEVGGTLGLASSLQSLTQIVAPVLGGASSSGSSGHGSLGVLDALIMGWLATLGGRAEADARRQA
jgi:DHA1 family tetracycline resistance protein-like MFS transporter